MAVQPLTRPPIRTIGVGAARTLRQLPPPGRLARRRLLVTWTKRLLPVFALLLLASIAAWPEMSKVGDSGRIAFRRTFGLAPEAVRLLEPRYRGVDERGRPYTVTADTAVQNGPSRVDLVSPKGDLVLENGAWLYVEAREGVYLQHSAQLDLSGDATVYRDDGTTLRSASAALDLKAGAVAGSEPTHAEGPFGTLDAQGGFTVVDKGAVVQFAGPARLVLRAAGHQP